MVSVPVVSVNGIFSETITFPSMMISSEPVGTISLLQLFRSDHTPIEPPTQIPLGMAPPKLPASTGDVSTEGADVPAAFFRFPLSFTVMVKTPTAGGVAPVESTIVITKVNPSVKEPV